MAKQCPECRVTDGSCRHPHVGHPRPVTLSDGLADDLGLELFVPAPRRSPENVRVR